MPPSATSPQPSGDSDDVTIISRGDQAASWSSPGTRPPAAATSTAEIGRVLEGSMLGPYRLERFVGGGGMGAVFRALDTTLDRIVAVKVLAGRQSDDEEMLKRFRNEAQSAARLDHENIGRVHAVGSENGWHFIVFEFIEGTNVRELVRAEGPFDLARTVDIAMQVADALEHASERDVVHRDIKPSNIVITPAGRARIVDMGLARLPQVADDRDLTVSGMTLGTFDYISPEQARDPRAADVRSDLYSLGCTIFFMLAGRPPFADGTMVQKLLQHQQATPPALDQIRSDVPPRFAAIVARLMAKDPLDRYQRPAVLVADLTTFADEVGLQLGGARSSASAIEIGGPPAASRLPWIVPLAALLTLILVMWALSARERRAAVSTPVSDRITDGLALVRVVPEPAATDESASLADASRRVADGGVIELGYDGERREPALAFDGRRVVIRAAVGRRPVVVFERAAAALGGVEAACDVGDGDVEFRGVSLRLAATSPAAHALFAIRSGRLVCEDVMLRMPGAWDSARSTPAPQAAIVAVVSPGSAGPVHGAVVLGRTNAAGDATFLDVRRVASGRLTLRWNSGVFASPRPLITAEGTAADPLELDVGLDGVVAACGAGAIVLRDSPSRPLPTRLRLRAAECRFLVADPSRPLLEQSGRGDVDDYLACCQWIDAGSRYEGGGEFRRIDAATERVDEAYRDVVPPLFHDATAGSPPDPSEWEP